MLLISRRHPCETALRIHATDMYRFAYWLCRERQKALDLVQDTSLRAWKSWDSLRDQSAVKPWLLSILRNEFARSFSQHGPPIADLDLETLDVIGDNCPSSGLEVREALHAMPESLRETLLLQVLGGFSCSEIATMLGTTEGAVMTRLTRARQAMRRLVDGSTILKEMTP